MNEGKEIQQHLESMMILDTGGVIRWAAPHIHQLIGYTSGELKGKDILDLLSVTPSKKRMKDLIRQLHQTCTEVNEGLHQFKTKDGQLVALYTIIGKLPLEYPNFNTMVHLSYYRSPDAGEILREKTELETELRKQVAQEIASELHDDINPSLVGARLLLEYSVNNLLEEEQHVRKAADIIKEAIHHIRDLSNAIVQVTRNNYHLGDSLRAMIDHYNKGDVRIVLRYQRGVEENLQTKEKVHMIRIVKEQLANIIRHAEATHVLISIRNMNGNVIMVTKDNGKGFDTAGKDKGIGILNMAQRVKFLGGTMHINSQPGSGTAIRIVFPMKNHSIPKP